MALRQPTPQEAANLVQIMNSANIPAARAFLAAHPDLDVSNIQDAYGATLYSKLLFDARLDENQDLIEELRRRRVNPHPVDRFGRTATDYAISRSLQFRTPAWRAKAQAARNYLARYNVAPLAKNLQSYRLASREGFGQLQFAIPQRKKKNTAASATGANAGASSAASSSGSGSGATAAAAEEWENLPPTVVGVPENVENRILGFLTGKTGNPAVQMSKLRTNAGLPGVPIVPAPAPTRRRRNRKNRKNRKQSRRK